MATIKRILFPSDFSRQGSLAVPFVRAIAEKLEAGVTIIGVVPPVRIGASAEVPVIVTSEEEELERDLKSRVEHAIERDFAGFTVRSVTAVGDPAQKIVAYAHDHDVDLIMMPTHGFGLFRSMLIGSVTAKVLHDARCPVWTATHAEEQRRPFRERSSVR